MEFIYKNDEINTRYFNGVKPSSIMDNINGTVYHTNYLDYLSKCYSSHNGIVVKPDYIWYTILCEIANIVKNDPESYRNIFTDSDEKKEILVLTADPIKMPIDKLINAVFNLIPSELKKDDILLNFSTTTNSSTFAFSTSFLDAVSPYYNYSMYLCGYNKINVLGSFEDYNLIKDALLYKLNPLFVETKMNDYLQKCFVTIVNLLENFNDENFWKNIFTVGYCGSGHQEVVNGWFSDLFNTYPKLGYVSNFPTHVSLVEYKNISTGKSFEMKSGILSSIVNDDYLIPDFEFYINEKINRT